MENPAIQNAASQTPLSDEEKISWLQLIRTENVGPVTFYKFIDIYGSAGKALEAIPEMAARGGRKKPLKIPPRAVIEREYGLVRKMGGQFITAADPAYPLALSATEDAPPVITVLGDPALLHKSCTAIVGARNASLNGRKFAEKLAQDLGAQGHIIVSGLARGIDTAAHQGALPTGTVAVVAGGIDVVYPSENQKLYEAIKEQGAIVAENPLGTAPRAQDFPRRNRIVSGLSQGVVVVEATVRSGSLITARMAAEQGRDVYAVPGHPMDPRASGPNKLIRDGATLIRDAEDVIENINGFTGGMLMDSAGSHFEGPVIANDDGQDDLGTDMAYSEEQARDIIISALSYTPSAIDEIVRNAGLKTSLAQTILMELELAGRIQRLPGNRAMLVQE